MPCYLNYRRCSWSASAAECTNPTDDDIVSKPREAEARAIKMGAAPELLKLLLRLIPSVMLSARLLLVPLSCVVKTLMLHV